MENFWIAKLFESKNWERLEALYILWKLFEIWCQKLFFYYFDIFNDIANVQLVDQVVCNVIEKHRGTLLRCIYCICCHKGCQMQDE